MKKNVDCQYKKSCLRPQKTNNHVDLCWALKCWTHHEKLDIAIDIDGD